MTPSEKLRYLVDRHPRAGQKIVALDLGVGKGTVSKVYLGKAGVGNKLAAKINRLYLETGNSETGNLETGNWKPGGNPLETLETGPETIATDLDALEAQVLAADAAQEFTAAPPPPPVDAPHVEQMPALDISWRDHVWEPVHKMVAGFMPDEARKQALLKVALSDQGGVACASSERLVMRSPLGRAMQDGAPAVDAAMMLLYVATVAQALRAAAPPKPDDEGEGEADTRPDVAVDA